MHAAQEPNPSRSTPVYISDDSIADLDPVSLVQKQTEIVLKGRDACGHTDPKTGFSHGHDIRKVSNLKLAFGPHYGELVEYTGGIDWQQVTTVLELIGRLEEDIVFGCFPKEQGPCFHLTGRIESPHDDTPLVSALTKGYNSLNLGFIGGTALPRPEGLDESVNWGASDSHIDFCRFIGFELDPSDEALRNPEEQKRILQEKCPDIVSITAAASFSGNKSIAGFIPLAEPVLPFTAKQLTRRVAQYIQDRAPELGPDFRVCNPARIWRLPGYPHQSTGERSKLVWTKRVTIEADVLAEMLPEVEETTREYRDSGVTDADRAVAEKLVSRWKDGLTYPLELVLGPKRLLEGFEEGGAGPNGAGRRPYAYSISCALQVGMNILDDLGVPYEDTHNDILGHFCETCDPAIAPESAYCVGEPGDPDKSVEVLLSDLHLFTIQKCGFADAKDKQNFEKDVAALREKCEARGEKNAQSVVRAFITAEDVESYAEKICLAYLKGGNNFGEVQALRSRMASDRIDVKAVESHVFTLLGKKWGIKHFNEAAANDLNHGVFAGGHGVQSTGGDYLVDGILIRQEPNIWIGQPGVGKTLHALQLAHSLIHGTSYLFGKPPTPLADDEIILIIETDADLAAETSIDRYETMLGYNNDPKWRQHVRVRRADTSTKANAWCIHPQDLQWLYEFITTHNVALVIIDSLSSACNESPLEAADEQENAFTNIFSTINSMVSQHSTLLWLHHTRKDGKFGGVTSITRKPSTVHMLLKKENQKTGINHYFWKQEKTRNMDEKTYEVFMGPDYHFFVATKDVKFDLEGSLLAILFVSGEEGLTYSQLHMKLELGLVGFMRGRQMTDDQEEVILEMHPEADPARGGDDGSNGGQGAALQERRLPSEWRFPKASRPTVSRAMNKMKNAGYVYESGKAKGGTKPASLWKLTEAGAAVAKPITDALQAAGFMPKRNWAKAAEKHPEGFLKGDQVTELDVALLETGREFAA